MNGALQNNKVKRTSQKEARRTVKHHIEVGDLESFSSIVLDEAAKKQKLAGRLARLTLRGPEIPLEDKLKMAEYALLVEPISNGLRSFIENPGLLKPTTRSKYSKPTELPVSGSVNRPSVLIGVAGQQIYWRIIAQLRGSDKELTLDRLIDARAKLLPDERSRAIGPLDDVLRLASTSSVNSMYTSAIANALTVRMALGANVSYFDVLRMTRNSTHLPISRPLVHLLGQKNVVDGVDAYNNSLINGEQPEVGLLHYDEETERVYLNQSVRKMQGPNGSLDERADELADAEIGCPVTFSPGLVKAYYETIVDLVDYHDLWPDPIVPRDSTYSLRDLSPM